jgi:hypothetical protein
MVVGFIIASLLRGKQKAGLTLPAIRGKFEATHSLPGRLRFRVPLVQTENQTKIENVRNVLSKIPDIRSVEINTRSGSILVQYDDDEIEPHVVCGLLIKVLDLESDLESHSESMVQREIRTIGKALDQTIYNSTAGIVDLKSAFLILLVLLGFYKIMLEKDRSLPSGVSLLWWAYVVATGRKR